ncbi:MAG: DUF4834 family protein [Bacteroidota bacterium]
MESVVIFFLYLVLFYFLAKILWKWLKPYILRYVSKKFQEKFQQRFNQEFQQQNDTNSDFDKGGFSTKQKRKTTKRPASNKNKKVGEYIDFEEIE